MNCPQCKASLPAGARFCPMCSAPLDIEESPQTLTAATESARSVTTNIAGPQAPVPPVRPWVRYWARMFDLTLFMFLIGIFLAVLAPKLFSNRYVPPVLEIGSIFLWVFVEALLLSIFGRTPGKWLFKAHLNTISRQPLRYSDAFHRSTKVWWRGMGAGIPFVSLITTVVAYNRLRNKRSTSWDREGHFTVTHERIGALPVVGAIAFFVAIPVLETIGLMEQRGFPSLDQFHQRSAINAKLRSVANMMNARTPLMINRGTRLDHVVAGDLSITYNYTLILQSASQRLKAVIDNLAPKFVNRVCTTKAMRFFVMNGVTINYDYYGDAGKQITEISVPASDCRGIGPLKVKTV